MASKLQNIGEEYQAYGKEGFDAAMRSYGEANQGIQSFAAEVTDYSKKAFDDYARTWEQLLGVKTFDQALQIQSQYIKRTYENYIAEMSKLGEMFSYAARSAYKPIESAASHGFPRGD